MVAESAEFTKAAADVKTLAKDPSNEQKLEVYMSSRLMRHLSSC